MSSDVNLHVLYRIANAPIRLFPFPHFFVQDVFPAGFYDELRENLPPKETFTTLKALGRVGSGYPDTRFVLPLDRKSIGAVAEPFRSFWVEAARWLLDGSLGEMILQKFDQFLQQRFAEQPSPAFRGEAMLVQDYSTYALGPHTDSPAKVVSLLFYLPGDNTRPHLGTSLYVPKDPNFRCPGGPHHAFENFRRVYTMPYRSNTLFGFLKTDHSFHGVEAIADTEVRRDLLLYDIKVSLPASTGAQASPPASVATAGAKSSL